MKLNLPIGIKILMLLTFAIGIGLSAYFWIASRLMISDKISYLYDYSFSQAKLAAIQYDINPTNPQLDRIARGFHIRIVDVPTRSVAFLSSKEENPLVELPIDQILQGISSQITSGVREFNQYIVAYDLIQGGKSLVLSYIPESEAFESVRTLQIRSMYGGLCIFLITLGLAFLLSNGISVRIRGLADATAKVADGQFGVQVSETAKVSDEVTTLSRTFNIMSAKISELLEQRVKQIRMEKELETAELLQSKFFPNEKIQEGEYRVEGQSWFASECGGDYWQHANLNPYLVTIMGDVTGHGASAALVTALIHGIFTSTVRDLQHMSLNDPAQDIIGPIIRNIHAGLKASAGENASFTCLLSVIDTRTQKMFLQNAGNPFPYLYRDSTQKFESLKQKNSIPLGDVEPTIEPIEVDIVKGDRLFLYTDGLFDVRLNDQNKIHKKEFFEELAAKIAAHQNEAHSSFIQERTADVVNEFFGKDRSNRPDDITIVVVEKT
ncbi:MAG: SpoIIE family protein phosphatase [Bdellovibrionales bacterium]|nr:SpoIIE family protein phosphatase [Bdellovibrionales bacterium]